MPCTPSSSATTLRSAVRLALATRATYAPSSAPLEKCLSCSCSGGAGALHSFPTRRSSDLGGRIDDERRVFIDAVGIGARSTREVVIVLVPGNLVVVRGQIGRAHV